MNLAIIGLVVGGIGLVWLIAVLARRSSGGRWGDSGYGGGGYGSDYDSDSGSGFWPAWLWWNSSSNDSPPVFDSPPLQVPPADAGCSDNSGSPVSDCGSSFSSDGGGFSGDSGGGGGGGCDCSSSGGGDCGGGGGGGGE